VNYIVLCVALPLLAAFLTPVVGRSSIVAARLLGIATLLSCITISWLSFCQLGSLDAAPVAIAIGGFMPPYGITFYVDQVAALFTLATAVMALLLWPADAETTPRHFSLVLLLVGACSALALSGDLFNIYVFYELVSVASFGLAAARGTPAAFAATLRYLIISGAGTVLALTGIAIIYTQTGTLNLAHLAQLAPELLHNPTGLAAFTLILFGIGVKAELFPVNGWVPEVYATSSSRTAGLLAGVVSKLAVLVLVRLLVLIFNQPEALQLLLILGVTGIIFGELSAWRSRDLNRMLAFSSIGQLGMVFIAFSLPGELGLIAGLALALHHLLVKPALFLLAERWGGSLRALQGAARSGERGALLAGVLFTLFALSLIGVPPFPGFWAKLMLIKGLVVAADGGYIAALVIFLSATVIEANYLFTLVVRLFAPADPQSTTAPTPHGVVTLGAATVMGGALLFALFSIVPLGASLQVIATQLGDQSLYINTVLPMGVVTP